MKIVFTLFCSFIVMARIMTFLLLRNQIIFGNMLWRKYARNFMMILLNNAFSRVKVLKMQNQLLQLWKIKAYLQLELLDFAGVVSIF